MKGEQAAIKRCVRILLALSRALTVLHQEQTNKNDNMSILRLHCHYTTTARRCQHISDELITLFLLMFCLVKLIIFNVAKMDTYPLYTEKEIL